MSLINRIKTNLVKIKNFRGIDPEEKNCLKIKVREKYEQEFYDAAFEFLEQLDPFATKEDAGFYNQLFELAKKRDRLGNQKTFLRKITSLIDDSRENSVFYSTLSQVLQKEETLLKENYLDEIVLNFKKAIQLDPQNVENHELFASYLNNNSRGKEAQKILGRAVDIEPNNLGLWNKLAYTYGNLKQEHNAYAAIKQIIQRGRNLDQVLEIIGPNLMFAPEDREVPVLLLEDYFVKENYTLEEKSKIHTKIGKTAGNNGMSELAEVCLKKAINEDQDNLHAQYYLFMELARDSEVVTERYFEAKKILDSLVTKTQLPDELFGYVEREEQWLNERGRGRTERVVALEGFFESMFNQYKDPKYLEGMIRSRLVSCKLQGATSSDFERVNDLYEKYLALGGRSQAIKDSYKELSSNRRIPLLEAEVNIIGNTQSRLELAEVYSLNFNPRSARPSPFGVKAAEQYDLVIIANPELYGKIPNHIKPLVDQMREERKK